MHARDRSANMKEQRATQMQRFASIGGLYFGLYSTTIIRFKIIKKGGCFFA